MIHTQDNKQQLRHLSCFRRMVLDEDSLYSGLCYRIVYLVKPKITSILDL